MKKIHVSKPVWKIIGALRISDKVFEKIEAMSKSSGVSNQEVIRAILDVVIDEVEI